MSDKKTPNDKICKTCFEKYQAHENVLHEVCYYLIAHSGGKDVKPPKLNNGVKK